MNETKNLVGSVSTVQEREQAGRINRVLGRNYRRYPHPISEEELT